MKVIFKENTNAVDEVLSRDDAVLFHVCNNKGAMNSGIAKEIRSKIPSAYDNYRDRYLSSTGILPYPLLGCSIESNTGNVVNLVAQDGYGYDRRKYITYDALAASLAEYLYETYKPDYKFPDVAIIPYKMGADRAGGDWDIVLEITTKLLSTKFKELIICEYNPNA